MDILDTSPEYGSERPLEVIPQQSKKPHMLPLSRMPEGSASVHPIVNAGCELFRLRVAAPRSARLV